MYSTSKKRRSPLDSAGRSGIIETILGSAYAASGDGEPDASHEKCKVTLIRTEWKWSSNAKHPESRLLADSDFPSSVTPRRLLRLRDAQTAIEYSFNTLGLRSYLVATLLRPAT